MAFQVQFAVRAEADVDSALDFLARHSVRAASRWHAALLQLVIALEDNPDRYPLAAEAERLGIALREILFGKKPHVYRVLFVIEGRTVNVLHVRHAARDWLKDDEPV